MLVLALDASTSITTVALAHVEDGEREILAETSVSSRGASETLLPSVRAVLDLAGEKLGSVDLILAGVGPGTFTGIRIATATARSLAFATGATLSKNSTLTALAAPARSVASEVLAVLDAKRGEVFARRFSGNEPAGEIVCVKPEELSAEGEPLLVGDGAVRYREVLSRLGRVPPDTSPLHRVTAVGHVLSADLTPAPSEEVVPVYVREPDAEVRRDLNPWSRS